MISLQIWDRRGAAFGEDPYVTPIVRQSHFNGKYHLAGPVGFALHPGEQRLFHYFTFNSRDAADGSVRCGTYDVKPGSIRFEYSISAENMRMMRGVYSITEDEMVNFIRSFEAAQHYKYTQQR